MPRYTDEQRACVERLVGPVDVSAGAGSGKTFTLTQRIAGALADPDSGVDSIDQVCAITFTEKAASELKGRVRSTLRAEGMFDDALKVDSAWISTIHGMCARILRASALDLGIDPEFKVLMGKVADDLLEDSLNEAVAAAREDGRYETLFREYASTASGGDAPIVRLVSSVLSEVAGLRGGFDDLVVVPSDARPRDVARELLAAYEEAWPCYEKAKPNKTNDAAREAALSTMDALEPYVAGEGEDTAEGLLEVLDRCPIAGALRSKDAKEATGECKAAHYDAIAQAMLLQGDVVLDQLIGLAREAQAAFAKNKRALAALDNNDLIKGALAALERPDVLARFEDRFRLVMVDEFQDTDALQLAIVGKLCGPGMRYLCTVGDAQQSIYGFRGADINVYRAYQRGLSDPGIAARGGDPRQLRLTTNFRSHGDILAFVKKVCAQPSVFGDGFLDLKARYDGSGYLAGDEPRIQLSCTSLVPERGRGSIRDAVEVQAREIAAYFTRMRESGHALSEMVLLLGAVKNADVYARAIRGAGYPCIIAGGSLFAQAPEVHAVNALLQSIANPCDTQALFAALSGPAFCLGASDLLRLGTETDGETGLPVGGRLDRGLAREVSAALRGASSSPALARVAQIMSKARRDIRRRPLSEVLAGVLRDSGWIARLQAQGPEGMAQLGNVMKAVRFVREAEDDLELGPSRAAAHFDALLEQGMREAPGALNLEGQEAIRIMTIHASKGLEFPIVALADFARTSSVGDLVIQRVEGETFVSLKGRSRTLAGKDVVRAAFDATRGEMDASAVTAGALRSVDAVTRRAALAAVADYEELSEAQRLFYVGATRAKEALGVFMCLKEQKTNPLNAYVSTVDDVRSAFFGPDGLFPEESCEVGYGGTAAAPFKVSRIRYADLARAREEEAAGATVPRGELGVVSVCRVGREEPLRPVSPERRPTGILSYTSVAHASELAGDALGLGRSAAERASDARAVAHILEAGRLGPDMDKGALFAAIALVEGEMRKTKSHAADLFIQSDGDSGDLDDCVTQKFEGGRASDDDKATDFGSALHRLCQIAALAGQDVARDRVGAMACVYGVSDAERLSKALERWLGSSARARALSYGRVQPEVSFSVPLGEGVLEGEIDLLCDDPAVLGENALAGEGGPESRGDAFIVDYKTGGYAAETSEQLRDKHALQACCYAYATLAQGYGAVDLAFVRVEQDDPDGLDTLETVSYRFTSADVCVLRSVLEKQSAGLWGQARGESRG